MGRRQDRLFRALLKLFPREFRGDFGDDMAADFQDQRDAAAASGRRSSVPRLWTRTIVDTLRRAPREHLDVLLRDAWYAIRLFGRRRAMTMSALVTLAVGIGLNAAAFGVIHGVLWRSLPLPDSDRLVRISEVKPPATTGWSASPGNVVDWEKQTRTLDVLATIRLQGGTIALEAGAEEFLGAAVSRNFFPMLPTRPVLGRLFDDRDYEPLVTQMAALTAAGEEARTEKLRPSVTIISHELWRRQFGGRADAIGQKVDFGSGRVVEVVGVAPADFVLPIFRNADAFFPDVPDPNQRTLPSIFVLGRLAEGATVEVAEAEFEVIAGRLAAAYPAENTGVRIRVMSLRDSMTVNVRTQLWFLFAAALCVLSIACANVINLLLALTAGRRRELQTRLAVGATRAHLVRQAVTEGLVLACAGGFLGLLLAHWGVPALAALAPRTMPRITEITVGLEVLLFTAAVSLAVGTASGAGAALSGSLSLSDSPLRAVGAAHRPGRRLRQTLIVAEVALALMLAIAASLLVQTMRSVTALPLGFTPEHAIAASITQEANGRSKADFDAQFVKAIRALPGVVAAGVGSRPLASGGMITAIPLPQDPSKLQRIKVEPVGAGYLEALGARVLNGRFFSDRDHATAPPVAIVNEAAALQYWSGDAVGRTFLRTVMPRPGVTDSYRVTIIGVLDNIRNGPLEQDVAPTLYLPDVQTSNFYSNNMLVRTAGNPHDVLPAIRTLVRSLDPKLPVSRVETLEDRLAAATAPRRFTLWLVGIFSIIALVLAAIGVYGVITESVSQRIPEIGVRMALGAPVGSVIALVVRDGAQMIGLGVALGIAGALAMKEVMSSFVFGVTPTDAWSYAIGGAALVAVTLAACLVPARRAARIDPVVALRHE